MRGPEEDKRDIHLQGLCRYLPHAVFPLCKVSLDSASKRGMTRTRHPAHDAGSRRGQARHSFTGSLPVFTSCSIPTLRLLSGFRVGARNDKNASPRTSMRGPEENKRDIHLQGLCRYLPHAVFPLCGYSLDSASKRGMTTYEKELQLPEALFVARPGYDPGTFPILYRDALTLRHNNKKLQASLHVLYELNKKEPQLPEALFVARPGYDPGTS